MLHRPGPTSEPPKRSEGPAFIICAPADRRILAPVDDFWTNAVFSVTPTIVVGLIFWFAMRAIIRADRAEREAYSDIEAQERARFEKLTADPHE